MVTMREQDTTLVANGLEVKNLKILWNSSLCNFQFDFFLSGNGWALMGATEALSAMKNLDLEETSLYKTLLQNFQFHAGNLR